MVTKKQPTAMKIESMLFTKVVKHVMSNAVVMANGNVVTGMARTDVEVDSCLLPVIKAASA